MQSHPRGFDAVDTKDTRPERGQPFRSVAPPFTGRTYITTRGPFAGQTITVRGRCGLMSDTHWLVEAECGKRWAVATERLRAVFAGA